MLSLSYRENDEFMEAMDRAAKNAEVIEVHIDREFPTANSKLWRRLKKCSNWKALERDLSRGHVGPQGAGITGVEIVLVTLIFAVLVGGLFSYAIFKRYRAELEVELDPVTKKVRWRIILSPVKR